VMKEICPLSDMYLSCEFDSETAESACSQTYREVLHR
jgi:hypothetical protein